MTDLGDEVDAKLDVGAQSAKAESDKVSVANLVKSKKQPPPEAPEGIRIRTAIVLSFWFVILAFGLPIWWKTTAIYRANLPLTEMVEWSEGKVSRSTSLFVATADIHLSRTYIRKQSLTGSSDTKLHHAICRSPDIVEKHCL